MPLLQPLTLSPEMDASIQKRLLRSERFNLTTYLLKRYNGCGRILRPQNAVEVVDNKLRSQYIPMLRKLRKGTKNERQCQLGRGYLKNFVDENKKVAFSKTTLDLLFDIVLSRHWEHHRLFFVFFVFFEQEKKLDVDRRRNLINGQM